MARPSDGRAAIGGHGEAARRDAGRRDAGRRDAGRRDAGRRDAGRRDAGRGPGARSAIRHSDPAQRSGYMAGDSHAARQPRTPKTASVAPITLLT